MDSRDHDRRYHSTRADAYLPKSVNPNSPSLTKAMAACIVLPVCFALGGTLVWLIFAMIDLDMAIEFLRWVFQ